MVTMEVPVWFMIVSGIGSILWAVAWKTGTWANTFIKVGYIVWSILILYLLAGKFL